MKRTASERDGGGRKETGLSAYVGSAISIITNDGRHILGTLKGFDQVQNLVIEGSRERVYSPDEGVETLELGLYLMSWTRRRTLRSTSRPSRPTRSETCCTECSTAPRPPRKRQTNPSTQRGLLVRSF